MPNEYLQFGSVIPAELQTLTGLVLLVEAPALIFASAATGCGFGLLGNMVPVCSKTEVDVFASDAWRVH